MALQWEQVHFTVKIQSQNYFFVDLYEGDLYKKPLLCQEFFTPVICISRKRNGIRQKTMLLQQNVILLLDGKQNRWCLSKFRSISFIKTSKLWMRSINFSRFIKKTLLQIFFSYFYNGLIFGGLIFWGAYIWNHFCVIFWWAYITEAVYIQGLIFVVLLYIICNMNFGKRCDSLF